MTSPHLTPSPQTSEQALSRSMPVASLEVAQATLLARYAPETRVRRIRWSQGETQALELGSGPPLLLVHGGLANALYWAPILPTLARSHRVLAVDLPGHGLADSFDYTTVDPLDHARTFLGDILDALELPAVAVVANSIGGLWSAAFALGAPHRVSRLALVGAPAGVTRTAPAQMRVLGAPLVGTWLGRRMMANPSREENRTLWGQILVVHSERLDDALLDVHIAHSRRNTASLLSLMRCAVGLRGLRRHMVLGERWQQLQTPTLLVCGERDAFITPTDWDVWETISARNPRVRLVRVPNAGHLPWLDDAGRIVDEVERFLGT